MEQSTTHEITPVNLNQLSEKHKRVIAHIVDGLPRYKAWQKEHPNCNNDESGRASVRNLLKRPDAQQYFIDIREERSTYIGENNQLSANGVAGQFKHTIEQAERMSKQLEVDNPMLAIQALNAKTKALTEYNKFMGLGVQFKSANDPHQNTNNSGNNFKALDNGNREVIDTVIDITALSSSTLDFTADIIPKPASGDKQ